MFVLHTLDIYYMIPYIYYENEMLHCLFPNHTNDNKKKQATIDSLCTKLKWFTENPRILGN